MVKISRVTRAEMVTHVSNTHLKRSSTKEGGIRKAKCLATRVNNAVSTGLEGVCSVWNQPQRSKTPERSTRRVMWCTFQDKCDRRQTCQFKHLDEDRNFLQNMLGRVGIQLKCTETMYRKSFREKRKKYIKNNKTAKAPNENLGPTKNSTLNTRQNTVNILTTNAAGLRYKAGDLNNKIKHFDSTIFSVQETHFARKGRFEINKYIIFEAIRKGKQKGGSMLGVHVDLCPVLVQEYSDKFELIVVEVQVGDTCIRIMTGYGPQEGWEEVEKMPFFEALESEVARAEFAGKSVIVSMDANSKLGPHYIEGDPHGQSKNGKLLADILDRHALIVLNGLQEKRTGIITRQRTTIDGVEKSVIDFVITS